jgi:hypothetical protein
MRTLVRVGGRLRRIVLSAGLGYWVVSASACRADGGPMAAAVCPTCHKAHAGRHGHDGPGVGTLGYGKPGLYPGFQGFGLGYHPGYGYGGAALGVGATGGDPYYGGPGYPHPWPKLQRHGGIAPFPLYTGPGFPTPDHPNYFGGIGPLVPDQPVVTVEPEPSRPAYTGDYGGFTGMVPYPETTFAPFVSIAATAGSSGRAGSANAPTNTVTAPPGRLGDAAAARSLGIDAEPVVEPRGERGLKVTKVSDGSGAEKAGLHDGDVIRSVNGYLTEQPGHLAWIVANAAPDNVLKMVVRTASDGEVRTITATLP